MDRGAWTTVIEHRQWEGLWWVQLELWESFGGLGLSLAALWEVDRTAMREEAGPIWGGKAFQQMEPSEQRVKPPQHLPQEQP